MSFVTEDEFQVDFVQNQPTIPYHRQFSLSLKPSGFGITGSSASGSDFFADDFGGTTSFSVMPGTLSVLASGVGELSLDAYRRVGHAYAVLIRYFKFFYNVYFFPFL